MKAQIKCPPPHSAILRFNKGPRNRKVWHPSTLFQSCCLKRWRQAFYLGFVFASPSPCRLPPRLLGRSVVVSSLSLWGWGKDQSDLLGLRCFYRRWYPSLDTILGILRVPEAHGHHPLRRSSVGSAVLQWAPTSRPLCAAERCERCYSVLRVAHARDRQNLTRVSLDTCRNAKFPFWFKKTAQELLYKSSSLHKIFTKITPLSIHRLSHSQASSRSTQNLIFDNFFWFEFTITQVCALSYPNQNIEFGILEERSRCRDTRIIKNNNNEIINENMTPLEPKIPFWGGGGINGCK